MVSQMDIIMKLVDNICDTQSIEPTYGNKLAIYLTLDHVGAGITALTGDKRVAITTISACYQSDPDNIRDLVKKSKQNFQWYMEGKRGCATCGDRVGIHEHPSGHLCDICAGVNN